MERHRHAHGFTMLELLMAVIIVGVLIAVGLPMYRRMMERGYLRQAEDLLLTIYSGERAFFLVNDRFEPVGPGGNWRTIHMDDPNLTGIPVAFSVDAAGSATATRTNGPCAGQARTIDQNRTFGGGWRACVGL